MPSIRLTRAQRLSVVIVISLLFFVLEITVGFRNHSLVLVADAFHVSNDLIGFAIALLAIKKAESTTGAHPKGFSFGWQRAELVGAFFNGVFLLALGVSIVLQTIERFVRPEEVHDPKLVLIVGGVGLGLNMLSAVTVHEHSHGNHSHGKKNDDDRGSHPTQLSMSDPHAGHAHSTANRTHSSHTDLGMLSVFLHLLGDAFNNLLVMLSAVVLMKTGFVYADPIASLLVGLMILGSSYGLVTRAGRILLECAPMEVDMRGVEKDVARVEGIEGVHEMHVWSLTQSKTLATVHVSTTDNDLGNFMLAQRRISECLHHWNIHNVTIQPELITTRPNTPDVSYSASPTDGRSIFGPGTPDRVIAPHGSEVYPPSQKGVLTCILRCAGSEVGCDKEGCCE